MGNLRGNLGDTRRQSVETVIHTLATVGRGGESLAEVAHDARNMVTALGLYCDLLEEPGVLALPFAHYGSELRLVAAASRRLVEKLVALDVNLYANAEAHVDVPRLEAGLAARAQSFSELGSGPQPSRSMVSEPEGNSSLGLKAGLGRSRGWESIFAEPICDMAAELVANRNLLAALAGPGIAVTMDTEGGARPVGLTAEDLTRLLVNLVKNAAEAMSSGGRIGIVLRERAAAGAEPPRLELTVEDNGPGIASEALTRIFDSGFTTHPEGTARNGGWPVLHRGLGLAIARSLVESAGGRIAAANRTEESGARFTIELPVRTV